MRPDACDEPVLSRRRVVPDLADDDEDLCLELALLLPRERAVSMVPSFGESSCGAEPPPLVSLPERECLVSVGTLSDDGDGRTQSDE